MNQDPALTPMRIDALNAVDLRLFGVTHGITEYVDGIPHVRGGVDSDFDDLLAATNDLSPERGDVLAIEPTGFHAPWTESLTLASIIPVTTPETPITTMSREDIVTLLETGRRKFHLNNLVYAAAHTLLRGVSVRRADFSRGECEDLERRLPELAPSSDAQNEIELFYRNTRMLARLGDIAIAMMMRRPNRARGTTDNAKPILLSASGATHSPRLGTRLNASGVSFTSTN